MDIKSCIASSATIHATAKIADNVVIGASAFIGENVDIGEGTHIGPHAIILQNTIMGKNNRIHSHAVVGGDSQDLKYRGEDSWLKMGDHNIVREFVTINRGSDSDTNTTYIGNNNCFFACSHVAHDARIGNGVLFVNNAVIGGHVTVDDFATIGAHSSVHQFCYIGAYSFLAHSAQIAYDIPPFMMATETPGIVRGLNLIGLRRHGFSAETIRGLKTAYRLLYQDGLSLAELKITLIALAVETAEVKMIIDLMDKSKRGVLRKRETKMEILNISC